MPELDIQGKLLLGKRMFIRERPDARAPRSPNRSSSKGSARKERPPSQAKKDGDSTASIYKFYVWGERKKGDQC